MKILTKQRNSCQYFVKYFFEIILQNNYSGPKYYVFVTWCMGCSMLGGGGRNSRASYLARIHLSFSSRGDVAWGLGRLFVLPSQTELATSFPTAVMIATRSGLQD